MDWNQVEPLNIYVIMNWMDLESRLSETSQTGTLKGDVHMKGPEELYEAPWRYCFSEHENNNTSAIRFQEHGDGNPEVPWSLIKE